jgi:hypothetical protein
VQAPKFNFCDLPLLTLTRIIFPLIDSMTPSPESKPSLAKQVKSESYEKLFWFFSPELSELKALPYFSTQFGEKIEVDAI